MHLVSLRSTQNIELIYLFDLSMFVLKSCFHHPEWTLENMNWISCIKGNCNLEILNLVVEVKQEHIAAKLWNVTFPEKVKKKHSQWWSSHVSAYPLHFDVVAHKIHIS